jgi:hypothetical protein
MASRKYESIDRKFLDTFYRECGREVTLAYTVLNQTNTWAVTFFAAVMGPSLVGLVKKSSSGAFTFEYPNPYFWLFLIFAWGILLRFLQRSALALANMYRWNELATATWEVVALRADHPCQGELNDNLVELVNRLMINWRDPRRRAQVLWGTLKLMYLVPLLVLFVLVAWGIVVLPRDGLYWLGTIAFSCWTVVELAFFVTWNKSRSQALRGDGADKFLELFRLPACPQPSVHAPASTCDGARVQSSSFSKLTSALAKAVERLSSRI